MPRRYELTEAQWHKIEDLLPDKAGDRGRTVPAGGKAREKPLADCGRCVSEYH